MKDEAFAEMVGRIDAIIEELEEGEATLEEGKQLKQEAIQLLEDAEDLLASGGGKVVVIEEHGGEIVETPFEPASRQ